MSTRTGSAVAEAFTKAGAEGRAALIPYLTGGYPDLEEFPDVLQAVASQADLVEVGIPFSDPLADGPTIQAASEQVLALGITTDQILDAVGRVSPPVPVLAMAYWNTIYSYGAERFAGRCRLNGLAGTIVPDLPPEEAAEWAEISAAHVLDTVFLLAPTSSDARIELVARRATGFIYCVSLTGVTGARAALADDLLLFLGRVREKTSKYLAVGFGISTPDHVRQVAKLADGVIIGSALIQRLQSAPSRGERIQGIQEFLGAAKEATRRRESAGTGENEFGQP